MATNLLTFRAVGIRASATSDHRKPNNPDGGRRSSSASGWWAPLFGWSSDADYIDSSSSSVTGVTEEKPGAGTAAGSVVGGRFVPGCFTPEKAKQLRKMTVGTASFHDVMYHSAIASRLASDFGNPSAASDQ